MLKLILASTFVTGCETTVVAPHPETVDDSIDADPSDLQKDDGVATDNSVPTSSFLELEQPELELPLEPEKIKSPHDVDYKTMPATTLLEGLELDTTEPSLDVADFASSALELEEPTSALELVRHKKKKHHSQKHEHHPPHLHAPPAPSTTSSLASIKHAPAAETTSSLVSIKQHHSQHQHQHQHARLTEDPKEKSSTKSTKNKNTRDIHDDTNVNIGDFHLKLDTKDPIHMLALGGGGSIGLVMVACALITFLIYAIRRIARWWVNFDFREAFPCIGRWMLESGTDKFEAFPVIVKINSINEHREPYRLRIRFRSKSYETPFACTTDGKWGCAARIMVPQGCDRLQIEAIVGHGEGVVEGSHTLLVWETMLQQTPVNLKAIHLHPSTFFNMDHNIPLTSTINDRRAGNVQMSFTLVDIENELPLIHGMHQDSYALSDELKRYTNGAPARGDESLEVLSKVLRGTLTQGVGVNAETKYFAVIKRETIDPKFGAEGLSLETARREGLVKSRWLLGWWKDEADFHTKRTSPVDYLSLLQCTSTRSDAVCATAFYVAYGANSILKFRSNRFDVKVTSPCGRHEFQLNCPGLERDVWVDGLYLAIAEARHLKFADEEEAIAGCESLDVYLEHASVSVRTRILLCLCACNACDAVETMSVGFILTKLSGESDTTKTMLAASVFIGMFFGGLTAGFYANSTGRKKVLVYALFLQGIAALIGSVMPMIELLMVMRFFSGLGIGATVPVLFIMAPEVVAPSVREAYLTYITGSFSFGSVFVALVAYLCFEVFKTSWKMFYGWTAVWPFITAISVMMVVPESPVYLAKKQYNVRLKKALAYLNPRATTAQVANVAPQPTDFGMQESVSRSFIAATKGFFEEDRVMKLKLVIINFVIAWVWYGLSTWAVSIFHNLGVDNPYLSALFFVICGGIGALSCIFYVQAAGMKAYILCTFFVAMVSACLSIFLKSPTAAVTLACVTNTAVSGLFNAIVTYQSVVPLYDRPLSTGVFAAIMRVGSIGAQFIMGYYASKQHQWIIHTVSTCLIAFALLSTMLLPNLNNSEYFKRVYKNAPIQTEPSD